MIQRERVAWLKRGEPSAEGRYVLYWMQQAQRASWNHALEYAIDAANERGLPVLAVFGLMAGFPEANRRHFAFMIDGLRETRAALHKRGIPLVVREGRPDEAALALADNAALIVCDVGYLRMQREWRASLAELAACPVAAVESDVIVPVEIASDKEEYAARTLRPKIHRHLETFLQPLKERRLKRSMLQEIDEELSLDDAPGLLDRLNAGQGAPPSQHFTGGRRAGLKLLDDFIEHKLPDYNGKRNDPNADTASHMSPYLHFGQLSALEIALAVSGRAKPAMADAVEAYLEELVVRRELAINFVWFNPEYDRYAALPDWARKTLNKHRRDPREYEYESVDWEAAQTHDPYWNAAQQEMVKTGKMHNYMRMYWGKKILEWSKTPEEAFETALYLNNKYELDGRDANSFAGVAWCFGKHDRPWKERAVFGTVRYMNAAGSKRKFDPNAYVERIGRI